MAVVLLLFVLMLLNLLIGGYMYQSDRRFILWASTPGLSRMLFRSVRDNVSNVNIDIIFWGVQYVETVLDLKGLKIEKCNKGEKRFSFSDRVSQSDEIFVIYSSGEIYYIIAVAFTVSENQNHFSDPIVWS